MKKPLATLGALGLGAALWGHFEAGWVRLRSIPVPIPGSARGAGRAARRPPVGLPPRLPVARGARGRARDRLDGRARSRSRRDHRRPPLATRGRGQAAGAPRPRARVVRGPRQPRLRVVARPVLEAERGLRPRPRRRSSSTRRGRSSSEVAASRSSASTRAPTGSGSARPVELADPDADLRILLCHFPSVIDRIRPGTFDLVLAGHLHAGQIVVPYGRGKVRFAHLRWTYAEGLYRRPGGVLHVSPGPGDDVRPVPLLRAARGDRARSRIGCREHEGRGLDRGDAPGGAAGLSRVRLVAVERGPRASTSRAGSSAPSWTGAPGAPCTATTTGP